MTTLLLLILIIACISNYSHGFTLQRNNAASKRTEISPVLQLSPQLKERRIHHRDRETYRKCLKNDIPAITDDDSLEIKTKKEGKIQALWNKYGPLYFQVWFIIYMPFLLTFFYILDNNLLQATDFAAVDPKAAVLRLFTWLEQFDPELLQSLKGNEHVTSFATAYLLADLVPTTVFALAAVTFIIKRKDAALTKG